MWRSWSHYRGELPISVGDSNPNLTLFNSAYKASSYLETVLAKGAILPQPSPELDAVYAKYAPPIPPPLTAPTPSPSKEAKEDVDSDASSTPDWEEVPESERKLILTRDAVPALTSVLGLRPETSFASDVYRALEQARLRLERAASESKSK